MMGGVASDACDPTRPPRPEGGWSEGIATLNDALIVPPLESDFVQPAGVLRADGIYCREAALWRRHRPITTEPAMPEDVPDMLPGRWLWGGVLWAHFGHFLVESTSRLWGLDHLNGAVDGVLFIPKRPAVGGAVRDFQTDFIRMMAPDLPVYVATSPTRVGELVVPGQGFGLGDIIAGTNRFRAAIHNRFGRGIAADGPEKLYLSRSALGLGKGGLLGEERLEALLREEGYEVFHPEQHDLPTQIARYKAARKVVAADGSALHLFAMVGRKDQQVAMILRRKAGANNLLAANIEHFCGAAPVIVDGLSTEWIRKDKGRSNRLSFGELNHHVVGRSLAAAGFVRPDVLWTALTERQRRRALADKGLGDSDNYVESADYEVRRQRWVRQERRAVRAARAAQE